VPRIYPLFLKEFKVCFRATRCAHGKCQPGEIAAQQLGSSEKTYVQRDGRIKDSGLSYRQISRSGKAR